MNIEIKWILVLSALGVLCLFGFIFTTGVSDCDDSFHLEGYFSEVKGSHIVIDDWDMFVSDWFRVDGNMPSYIKDYVGYNVSIDYYAGCGRRYITDFEIIN